MAFGILSRKDSETRKRFDLEIEVQPLFKANWTFKMRVVAYEPLSEDDLEDIIDFTIGKKNEWKECKKNCVLNVKAKSATVFIDKPKEPEHEQQPE